MGQFGIGNKFWERRSTHGKELLFASSDLLWQAAKEYFEDCLANQVEVKDWVGKDAIQVTREKPLPFSIAGFCVFVGASRHWWNELRKSDQSVDYLEVMKRIEDVIFTQQYNGAVTGVFQHNIVARALGLAEKNDTTVSGQVLWHEEKTYDKDEAEQETNPGA